MDWIKVELDLPPLNEVVDVCDIYSGFCSLGVLVEDPQDPDEVVFNLMWVNEVEHDSQPTHWKKRPELPRIE